VDYLITSPTFLSQVQTLKVGELTEYSDHKPLTLQLMLKTQQHKEEDSSEPKTMLQKSSNKYIWNQESPAQYKEGLELESESLVSALLKQATDACDKESCTSLCESVSKIYTIAADKTLTRAKDPPKSRAGVKPWFDGECKVLKMTMDRDRRGASNRPFDEGARTRFHDSKRSYKRCLKLKKNNYMRELNEELDNDGNINWKTLKKLKKTDSQVADNKCPQRFFTFFKDLYGKDTTVAEDKRELLPHLLEEYLKAEDTQDNEDEFVVTVEDLNVIIKTAKSGKAAGRDEITNEMIKCSNHALRTLLVESFNCCIRNMCFPWKESVIIPLHKKGPTDDPDMYRPISLSSCLGKVLSQLILKKFQEERTIKCPERINQAGFCKGSMTADHILTIHTIANKYKKLKQPVYGAFIDFRKAFDLVWRDGLMYKLAEKKFSKPLLRMIIAYYKGRKACLRMDGDLTDTFATILGVIQGEPPSPDQFKFYLHDVSPLLDEAQDLPELDGVDVSHLLWADDLYINSLSPEGLQELLDILHAYSQEWGLIPNPSKCNVIIFNGDADSEEVEFKLGDDVIAITDSYTYLGLEITKDGKLAHAAETLAKKGKRAIGSLMGSIDKTIIKPALSLKLFNSLAKPILLYGAQIWAPLLASKQVLGLTTPNMATYFKHHSETPGEKVHLRLLKWILGVHKKTTNAFCWGELGEFPLVFSAIEQANSYYSRLMTTQPGTLLFHTMQEQKKLNLQWWDNMTKLQDVNIQKLKTKFVEMYVIYNTCHSKTQFLAATKTKFGMQLYLQVVEKFNSRRTWAKIRGSATCLAIETGRYKRPVVPAGQRLCLECQKLGIDTVEDEMHFLTTCPSQQPLRASLLDLAPDIAADTVDKIKDRARINSVLDIISKMYYDRAMPPDAKVTTVQPTTNPSLNLSTSHHLPS